MLLFRDVLFRRALIKTVFTVFVGNGMHGTTVNTRQTKHTTVVKLYFAILQSYVVCGTVVDTFFALHALVVNPKGIAVFFKNVKTPVGNGRQKPTVFALKIHAEGLVCIYQTANFLYFRQRLPYYLDSGFFVGHFPARKIVVGHNDVGKSRKVKIPVFEYFCHANACVTAAFAGSCNAVELVTALKLCLFQKFFDFLRKTPCVYGGHNYKRTLRAENPRRTAFENVVQTDDIVACAVCNVVCYKTGVARCGKIQYHYSSCGIKTKRLVPFTNQSIKSLLQAKKRSLHSWKNNKGLHCLPVTTFDITVLASVARFFTLQKHMQKLTNSHIVTYFLILPQKGKKQQCFAKHCLHATVNNI